MNEEQFNKMKERWEKCKKVNDANLKAITDTLKFFPVTDLARAKNSRDFSQYEFEDGRLVKAFGIEIQVYNPECKCFALRKRNDNGFLALVTTFDFITVTVGDKTENWIWCGSLHVNGRTYSTFYMESLAEWLDYYITNNKLERDKLVIVDDSSAVHDDYDDYDDYNEHDDYDDYED